MTAMEIRLEDYQYYIRPGYTDMRKGPTSLAYLAQYEMGLEPFSKSVFLFCGRSDSLGQERLALPFEASRLPHVIHLAAHERGCQEGEP